MAQIQFFKGIDEEVVPDVRLTRSRSGNNGTATFYFDKPKAIDPSRNDEIVGMYLIDEEGELITREVKGKFINGQAVALEAMIVMKSSEEWDRFMRFMERYAESHGLGFSKA
ncbi:MAG TPA: photosystem II reaction center protein Psb28 [Cyanobacteria bacterium UBA11149]|nr:photosystem II reaction center protein Psb28 [Cyanobacteria bacterium UBA11367]HBE59844.1 photosystem II reaction center protein Psb28 [Cyanobacteria bacterium UBA11366]HBK66509.1 photosystem II reaction center protein Psb28 [Cyanobacteria bacterium UBA11166]HBR74896.1 photosystem II reaction center protein Psb28 [Cyanobacteria bacterium UBA11159]HBS69490.1 photosystem II reaction center protein Psb28 [Cyanobacteria bacterium UBA11153]HBW89772.1 photosystem II reaction center protein Psb28 